MKGLVLGACVLAVVVVIAALVLFIDDGPRWSTDSAEAAEHLDAAIDAEQKFYRAEAREHLGRALEADPDLIVAKALMLELVGSSDKEKLKELVAALEGANLEALTEREQFLVKYHVKMVKGEVDELGTLLDDYVQRIPNDPFVVSAQATAAWAQNDWETADPLYRRLLEIEPNWVFAYNQLGYMEMARGRFQASEEMFMRYRFIAPDQANPHDSLGELFFLLGRHDEARGEFEAALAARPDFYPSYEHLLSIALAERDWDEAADLLERAEEDGSCPERRLTMLRCAIELWRAIDERAWDRGWETLDGQCGVDELGMSVSMPSFIVAFESGHRDVAATIRSRLEEFAGREWPSRMVEDLVGASLDFVIAYERANTGDLEGAAERLRAADGRTTYQGCQLGRLKLSIRLSLARVLEELGRSDEARRLVAEVADVNPRMAERYREDPSGSFLID